MTVEARPSASLRWLAGALNAESPRSMSLAAHAVVCGGGCFKSGAGQSGHLAGRSLERDAVASPEFRAREVRCRRA
jgi:hypothetical protein